MKKKIDVELEDLLTAPSKANLILQPSIVFIQTAFIGDLFLSLPTIDRLKKKFSNHQIILICKKGLSEIFIKENKVDFAFEVEKGNSSSYTDVLKKLKNFHIDIVICPHQSLRSTFFAAKIKSKNKIGFKSKFGLNNFFFDTTITYQKKWPDVIRQLNILTSLDQDLKSEIEKNDWAYLNFKNHEGNFLPIPEIFSYQNTFKNNFFQSATVAVFPGSVWKTKQWTTHGFSEVVSELLKKNKTVLLMGGPSEKQICDQIQTEVLKKLAIQNLEPQKLVIQKLKMINLAGAFSLYESFLKLKSCEQVICNDSAPAHMATSLGLPVISVFGPTTVDLGFRPWSDTAVVVENLNLKCRPCGAHGHHQCPKGHHRCMVDLKSEVIIQNNL